MYMCICTCIYRPSAPPVTIPIHVHVRMCDMYAVMNSHCEFDSDFPGSWWRWAAGCRPCCTRWLGWGTRWCRHQTDSPSNPKWSPFQRTSSTFCLTSSSPRPTCISWRETACFDCRFTVHAHVHVHVLWQLCMYIHVCTCTYVTV